MENNINDITSKTKIKTSLIESMYNEILTNTNSYYYFFGNPLPWENMDSDIPPNLLNHSFENFTRQNIVLVKKITISDVALSIPRIDWVPGTIYDQYDNSIGVIESYGVISEINSNIIRPLNGTYDMNKFGIGWLVTGKNVPANTRIIDITPNAITVSKRLTSPVSYIDIINVSYTGARMLEESRFYVMTENYNVYKCLDNNNNAPSTIRPYSSTNESVRTTDGYLWKYMYTIPISLVNKFITTSDIPVSNAIKNRFYSRGGITSAIVESSGYGYSDTTQLMVLGDGNLEDNVHAIQNINVLDPGSGYTFIPKMTIDPPYDSELFIQKTNYLLGQYVHNETGEIYEVIVGGMSGTYNPTHTAGSVINGSCVLKYVGITPNLKTSMKKDYPDEINAIELSGVVGDIKVITAGSGYNPNNSIEVNFSYADGFGARAIAEINSTGNVQNVLITNRGSYYSYANVTIEPPKTLIRIVDGSDPAIVDLQTNTITCPDHGFMTGTRIKYKAEDGYFSIGNIVTGGVYYAILVSKDQFQLAYTVIDAYKKIPIKLTSLGTGTQHTFSEDHVQATASVEIFKGYGYQFVPNIVAEPPFVADLDFTPNLSVKKDQIVKVRNKFYKVSNTGITGNLVPISTGTVTSGTATFEYIGRLPILQVNTVKTQAKLIPVIDNGAISGVIIQDPGVGYTTADIVINGSGTGGSIVPNLQIGNLSNLQANTELLAIPGTIDRLDILYPGAGYSYAEVEIEGDGTGCEAAVVIGDDGSIKKINVTSAGANYTYANVIITGNTTATQAYAKAVISPILGHGKDAVHELMAQNITLATTLARDKNHGIIPVNEYRQHGIIKNIEQYSTTTSYNDIVGSSCYVISGDFNFDIIENNMILTDNNNINFVVLTKSSAVSSRINSGVKTPDNTKQEEQPIGPTLIELLVMSLDNRPPIINSLVKYTSFGKTFTATISSIIMPDINKYSGELVYVDNRAAFKPSNVQTLSFKTTIKV